MAENTKIEWTDHTFNPWEGCQKVSPGCDHCYAETRNSRFNGGQAINWGPGAPRRRTSAANWAKPLKWQANAAAFFAEHGRRQRVFCASLADVFDNTVDHTWRDDLWELIYSTPDLDWLLLTKRIGNVKGMLPVRGRLPSNVMLGATITSQPEADRDIRKLLAVPAGGYFVSVEPLLGPVDFTEVPGPESGHGHHEFSPIVTINALKRADWNKPSIGWVIVGGESGPGARPIHPDWARSLRDQCQAAGVPFLFKQWGEWGPVDFEIHRHKGLITPPDNWDGLAGTTFITAKYPDGRAHQELFPVKKVGKKAAGRLLDGVEHNGFPGGAQ